MIKYPIRLLMLPIMLLAMMGCPRKGSQSIQTSALNFQFYSYNGLRMVHSPGNEALVTYRMLFSGGAENYPENLQGIEKVALQMVIMGSPVGKTRTEYLGELNKIGAALDMEIHPDFSAISLVCPRESWKKGFELFAALIQRPELTPENFATAQKQAMLEAQRTAKDPDRALWEQGFEVAFPGKAYARHPGGSEATLTRLSFEKTQEYYKDFLLQKCRLALIWAGMPDRYEIEEQVTYTLDALPAGNCVDLNSVTVFPTRSSIQFLAGNAPQYRLMGIFPGPPAYSTEAGAMELAMRLLSVRFQRAFMGESPVAIRVNAVYDPLKYGMNHIWVETAQPNRCAGLVNEVLRSVLQTGFEQSELDQVQNLAVSQCWLSAESGEERTRLAGLILLAPDRELACQYPGILQTANLQQVNAVFGKYCTGIQWVGNGPETGLDERFFSLPLREP